MDAQNKVDRYFSKHANKYAFKTELGLWRAWKEKEFKSLLSLLPPLENCSILEVGCGRNWYAKRLINFKPSLYVAIDRLHTMLEPVNKVFTVVGDLTQLPIRHSFDYILCFGALEFVKTPSSFFKQAKQLLKTGGKIIILVPRDNFFGQFYKLYHACHGLKINLFSNKIIRELCLDNGLITSGERKTMLFGKIVTFKNE